MDISDVIPVEPISQLFDIPQQYRWAIVLSIFVLGYPLFKIVNKKGHLRGLYIDDIDKIALIMGLGFIWLFRSLLISWWILAYILAIINKDVENGIYAVYPLSLGIFSSIILIFDILFIKDPSYNFIEFLKRKPKKSKEMPIGYTIYGLALALMVPMLVASFFEGAYCFKGIIITLFLIISCYLPWSYLLLRGFRKITVEKSF